MVVENKKKWRMRWGATIMMGFGAVILSLGYQNCALEDGGLYEESLADDLEEENGSNGANSPANNQRVPDKFRAITGLASSQSEALANSCQTESSGTWQFLHHAVGELRKEDNKWGYLFENCNQNQAFAAGSRHSIAYFVGNGNDMEGNTAIATVKVIRDHCGNSPAATWETPNSRGCWTYPWSDCTQPLDMEDFVRDFPDNANTQLTSDANHADYLDELIAALNGRNSFGSWGYLCKRGDCTDIATKRVAYGCQPNLNIQNGESPWERVIPVFVIDGAGTGSDWNPRGAQLSSWWVAERPQSGSSPSPGPSASSTPTPSPTPAFVEGRCGTYKNNSNASCMAGNFHNHPGHTPQQYRWTCRSIPHQPGANGEKREDECTQNRSTGGGGGGGGGNPGEGGGEGGPV